MNAHMAVETGRQGGREVVVAGQAEGYTPRFQQNVSRLSGTATSFSVFSHLRHQKLKSKHTQKKTSIHSIYK